MSRNKRVNSALKIKSQLAMPASATTRKQALALAEAFFKEKNAQRGKDSRRGARAKAYAKSKGCTSVSNLITALMDGRLDVYDTAVYRLCKL